MWVFCCGRWNWYSIIIFPSKRFRARLTCLIFLQLTVPYIDKEVNYVITDLPGYNGKPTSIAETSNIISPQCYSVSPATSVSGDDPSTAKKTVSTSIVSSVCRSTRGNILSSAYSERGPMLCLKKFPFERRVYHQLTILSHKHYLGRYQFIRSIL